MAISRIAAPGASPTSSLDYTQIVAQLAALLYHSSAPVQVVGANIIRGSLFNIGGVMYVATSDTAISGTQTDYVQITASGAAATAAFVASLTGVSWNSAYNGYYDSSGKLYLFDEVKATLSGIISVPHAARFANSQIDFFTYAKQQVLAKRLIANQYHGGPIYDALSAGDTIVASKSFSFGATGTSYLKAASYLSQFGGTLRIRFTLAGYSQSYSGTVYGCVYKNGVAVGFEKTIAITASQSQASQTQTFSEDITFNIGDTIEVWVKTSRSSGMFVYMTAVSVGVSGVVYGAWA